MKCSTTVCVREATHAPKICVPPTGYPLDLNRAMTMILGVQLCRDCCALFDPRDVLDVPNDKGALLRDALPALARLTGRVVNVLPDPDRAWIVPVRLDSKEYESFAKAAGPK